MQLSSNIRSYRKERGLTQEQLAEALGVTASAVYKWEASLSTPDINLIVELADLFDTSVDALLGYEVRDNKRAAAAARLRDLARRRDACGLTEADKLLIRYPNCFEIVYQSAELYGLFGFMRRDRRLLLRSIALMGRARLLIGQNTDPEISELSIDRSIARAYSSMGEHEKAVEIFRSSDPLGIYDDIIGCILGADLHRPDEAVPYLSRALIHCVSSLARIVIGYFNVYFDQGNFPAAIEILHVSLDLFSELRKPGQNSFLDKISTEFYVYLAMAQAGQGCMDEARGALRAARALAEQFDRAPDYSVDSIRFAASGRPGAAFDDMGATAMACILNLLEIRGGEALTALWRGITAEGAAGERA